jgi:hypothetical protein
LLVAADGRRFVLANAIEMPRLLDEELAGLDYEPVEYPWTEDQDPSRAVRAARGVLGEGALGATGRCPDTTGMEPALARAAHRRTKSPATARSAARPDVMLGNRGRALTAGRRRARHRARDHGWRRRLRARPIVTLVGSDERLRSVSPSRGRRRGKAVVMVALCAERDGVSLSRVVRRRSPISRPHAGARSVFGRLLDATHPGATRAATPSPPTLRRRLPGEEN